MIPGIMKKLIALFIAVTCFGTTAYAEQVHRVAPGETISGIAKKYGITTDALLGNNQYISNPNMIYFGQVLIIPDKNQKSYVVRPGDTLYQISRSFGISMDILAGRNNIAIRNYLYVGQVLQIPQIYTVKAGDTLYGISRSLGMTVSDLATENGLEDINMLFIGQRLILPRQPIGRESLADFDRQLSPLAGRFPDTFFYKGAPGHRRVALTFDDGPASTATVQILDLLKLHQVPATFFLLGNNLEGKEHLVKRMIAEGHTVANHTWSHPDMRTLTEAQLTKEVLNPEQTITAITGLQTALLRPPYGFISDQNLEQLRGMGYKVINWSVDSKDWHDLDMNQVLINTMPEVRDGSILLLHDYFSYSATQEALTDIIQSLKWQGFTFVTVDKLLGVNAYK